MHQLLLVYIACLSREMNLCIFLAFLVNSDKVIRIKITNGNRNHQNHRLSTKLLKYMKKTSMPQFLKTADSKSYFFTRRNCTSNEVVYRKGCQPSLRPLPPSDFNFVYLCNSIIALTVIECRQVSAKCVCESERERGRERSCTRVCV